MRFVASVLLDTSKQPEKSTVASIFFAILTDMRSVASIIFAILPVMHIHSLGNIMRRVLCGTHFLGHNGLYSSGAFNISQY